MKKSYKKQNNKGFSLLEVLIAMTILAIIVVPLLHAFVTATVTNTKAKKIMRATTLAQNTLENIKGTSIEDISRNIYGFTEDESGRVIPSFPMGGFTQNAEDGIATVVNAFEASYDGATGKYTQTTKQSVSAVGSSTSIAVFNGSPNNNGTFNYVFPNVEFGGTYYDAAVRISPYKSAENVNISSMNRSDCVYFMQAKDQAKNAAESFAEANQDFRNKMMAEGIAVSEMTEDQFTSKMTRTITLDLVANGSDSVSVSVKYNYDCGTGYTDEGDRYFLEQENAVKDITSAPLSAVYIYYYPLYGNAVVRDNFVINNRDNIDVDVYIIYMQDASYSSFNYGNYRATMNVQETYIPAEYVGVGIREKLHTALFSNMSNEDAARWSVTDNNDKVVTDISPLGNFERIVYQYEVEIYMYSHNDDAFSSVGGKMQFSPESKDYQMKLDGSVLDSSR